MAEVKMSDLDFALPLLVESYPVGAGQSKDYQLVEPHNKIPICSCISDKQTAIALAYRINSHDTLTARLKDAESALSKKDKEIERLREALQHLRSHLKVGSHLHDITVEALNQSSEAQIKVVANSGIPHGTIMAVSSDKAMAELQDAISRNDYDHIKKMVQDKKIAIMTGIGEAQKMETK